MTWWGPVCKPRTWEAETGEFPVGIPSVKKKNRKRRDRKREFLKYLNLSEFIRLFFLKKLFILIYTNYYLS